MSLPLRLMSRTLSYDPQVLCEISRKHVLNEVAFAAIRFVRIRFNAHIPSPYTLETLSTTKGATTTAYREQIFCSGHAQKLNN